MKNRIALWIAGLGLIAAASSAGAQEHHRFENLGVPVTKAILMATAVGPDATGKKESLYFDFAQTGSTLFLVAVDPDTGEAKQYKAPVGPGAWALIRGPDEKMYLGTWESGYILKFDPQDMRVVQTIALPDTPLDISLGRHPSGLIWGLTSRSVFAGDPDSGQVAVKADAPVPIQCGFALGDDAVYFGSGAHLWRYRFR